MDQLKHEQEATETKPPKVSGPSRLRRLFNQCSCTTAGAGALLSHIVCCVVPSVIAGTTGALSGAMMHAVAYTLGPLVAVAATVGIDKYKGRNIRSAGTLKRSAVSAAIAFTVAVGLDSALDHDHVSEHEQSQIHETHHQDKDLLSLFSTPDNAIHWQTSMIDESWRDHQAPPITRQGLPVIK